MPYISHEVRKQRNIKKGQDSIIGTHTAEKLFVKNTIAASIDSYWKAAREIKEIWQCSVYRKRGRSACSAHNLGSSELDIIMATIFEILLQNKGVLISNILKLIQSSSDEHDYEKDVMRIEHEIEQLSLKKDRLLEMSIEGAISTVEFKTRNDGFNIQISKLEDNLDLVKKEKDKSKATVGQLNKIKKVLENELSFEKKINSGVSNLDF